jgi:hypothetical protein
VFAVEASDPRQDMATLIDGLREAILYFGGVPETLGGLT